MGGTISSIEGVPGLRLISEVVVSVGPLLPPPPAEGVFLGFFAFDAAPAPPDDDALDGGFFRFFVGVVEDDFAFTGETFESK